MTARFSFFLTLFLSLNTLAGSSCFDDTSEVLLKAQQLKQSGQYLLAAQQFSLSSDFACSKNEKALAILGYAQSIYKLNENLTAESSLDELFSIEGSDEIKKKGRLLKAWYNPNFRIKLLDSEQKSFSEFENQSLIIQHEVRPKSPWAAGVLSAIVPGLGQAYNGNYQSAALSFLLNSIFLATAVELSNHDLKTSALAAGVIFSITYTGNILGSVQSANTINDNYRQPLIDEQRLKTIPELEL